MNHDSNDLNIDDKISELVSKKKIQNQMELRRLLEKEGISVNQSSISRALSRIGIEKIEGTYQVNKVVNQPDLSDLGKRPFQEMIPSGTNLIVIRTWPGIASRIGYIIDESNCNTVAGTIAGDDTLFVALRENHSIHQGMTEIQSLFQS